MAKVDGASAWLAVMVEDSADTRLFIELSSYASDLTEAHHALDLAIQGQDAGSSLTDASPYLMGFAVVAYCRTISHSNVRGRMTDHVQVPDDLIDIHEQIRIFRNATVAHSQSELSVTYPMGFLEARTREVKHVSAVTMITPLPKLVAQRFRTLLEAMVDQLDQAIEPVSARLESALRRANPDELLAGKRPELLSRAAEEFNPRSTRRPYPTRQTLYWDQSAPGDE